MWEVGDKITFIKNGQEDSTDQYGFEIGRIYTITYKRSIKDIYVSHKSYTKDGFYYAVNVGKYDRWFIEPSSFELVKKKIALTEADMLDNIQENFKNGF